MASDAIFIVKVCGITSAEDARVAVDAGANALGFNFFKKSPRYLNPQRAAEIANSVPGDYLRVGVFVNADEDELLSIGAAVPLHILQLHGNRCAIPASSPYRIWKSIPGESRAPSATETIEAYLLDAVSPQFGGSGNTFDWASAANFPHRAIVAGGLDASNVAAAIAAIRPWGVDACSRLESRPGQKDAQRVRDFVRAALHASQSALQQELSL
jgi:phosphoribosylanthranilate isomerase